MGKFIKLAVIVAILYFGYTVGRPWFKKHFQPTSSTTLSLASGSNACVDSAMQARDAWGSGIGQYVNPPADKINWSNFRSDIDSRISSAQSDCGCAKDSCRDARAALSDISTLLHDLDTAVENDSPPPMDLAQRQERVDQLLDRASDLAQQGK